MGDLQAEAGQRGRPRPVVGRAGQQHLARAARRGPGRQRHREPLEPVRVDSGKAVVQPVPPGRGTLHAGQPVDRLPQRQPAHPEGAQLGAALQPGGQQRRQHLGEDPYRRLARPLHQLRLDRTQRLRAVGAQKGYVGVGLLVRPGRGEGRREEGRTRQQVQHGGAHGPVDGGLAQRARDQADGGRADRAPGAEQPGVRLGGAGHQEVGERARGDVPAGGVQRERGDEQRGHAQRLVAGRGGVDDRGGRRADRGALAVDRDRPHHRPVRPQPLLDRAVGQKRGVQGAAGGRGTPAARLGGVARRSGVAGRLLDDDVRLLVAAAQDPGGLRSLHHDLGQPRQGEQQGVVHARQQAFGQILGGRVPQREDDHRVVPLGRGALCGEREPQQGDMAVAADQLVAEARAVAGHLAGGLAGLGQVPADAAGAAQYGRFVADREDGGEADAEAADARAGPGGGLGGRALGGCPERRQGFDAGGVERGARVGRGQDVGAGALVQGQAEAAVGARAGRGVGGVLGQFHDEAVAVAAENEVFLGVGVLAEPGRGGGP
ncbi:hypothetical protein EES44_26260 [Streptomyces sp. ADI96-15]|nr:hypothetical protein EES44_26260 [Streptomyces sp. ADI96-15]